MSRSEPELACEIDLRPGGIFSMTMRSPEGDAVHGSAGCYLEVVEHERLVWTDALSTGLLPLEPCGAGTRYVAIAKHAERATRASHEEMGFHAGWSTGLDQLVQAG